jgi:hypothetical protein
LNSEKTAISITQLGGFMEMSCWVEVLTFFKNNTQKINQIQTAIMINALE